MSLFSVYDWLFQNLVWRTTSDCFQERGVKIGLSCEVATDLWAKFSRVESIVLRGRNVFSGHWKFEARREASVPDNAKHRQHLLIGGSGVVGTVLTERLIAHRQSVLVVDPVSPQHPDAVWIAGDDLSPKAITDLVLQADGPLFLQRVQTMDGRVFWTLKFAALSPLLRRVLATQN